MFAAKLSSMLPSVCDITHFHHPHMCCVFALSATVWQVYRQCGRALFGMWYLGYVFRIFHFVLRKCKLELDAQPIRKVTLTYLPPPPQKQNKKQNKIKKKQNKDFVNTIPAPSTTWFHLSVLKIKDKVIIQKVKVSRSSRWSFYNFLEAAHVGLNQCLSFLHTVFSITFISTKTSKHSKG